MGPLRGPRHRRIGGHWSSDTVVVDGYRDAGVPWPVETTRFTYLTPYGGQSDDLGAGTVGLNRQALEENTELAEGDQVTITVYQSGGAVPYMFRRAYEVVALDFGTPDGFLRSVDGQAVLAAQEPEVSGGRLRHLRDGAKLVLNGVLGRGPREATG